MHILKRFTPGFAVCLCAIALLFLQQGRTNAMPPLFPVGDTVFNNAPLVFNPDTDVTWYEARIVNNGKVKHQQWYEAAQICNMTECYVDHGVDYSDGVGDQTVTWSYRGYNAVTDSVGAWVETDFTLLAAAPTAPTTVTDGNGVTTLTVTNILDSSITSEVPYYRIYVQNNADNSQVFYDWVAVDTCDMNTCTLDPLPKMLYNGSYTAWMQGYSLSELAFGYTAWSDGFTFTVNGAAPIEARVIPAGMLNSIQEVEINGETELLPSFCTENADPMLPTYTCGSNPLLIVAGAPLTGASLSLRQGEAAFDTVTRNLDETVAPRPEAVQVQVRQGTTVVFQQWYVFGVSPVCQFDAVPALCAVPLEGLTAGVEYNYRVRHYGASQPSPWAEDPAYTFEIGPNTNLTPATFTVDEVNGGLVILWEAGIGAAWYEIVIEDTATNEVAFSSWRQAILPDILSQIDLDPEDVAAIYDQYVICEFGNACQAIVFPYLPNGNYTWKIRGWVEGELGAFSTPQPYNMSFPVPEISTDPGDLDVQRTMIDVEGNTQPIFIWVADEGAQWFNLIVRRADSSVVFNKWFSFLLNCGQDGMTNELDCGYQSPVNLAPGSYTYTLQAWGPGGLGPVIPAQDFTINGAIPPAPTLDAPAGDIADNYPLFTWQPATNASWYEVEIRRGSEVVHSEWIYRSVNRCALGCSYNPELSLTDGAHTWRVRGASAGGVGAWSSGTQFNVTTPLQPATINGPGASFYTGDITFSWEALENATYYGVTVYATDRDLLTPGDFVVGDAVYTQWFSAEELNCEFDDAPIILIREGDQQQRMTSSTCEIVIPDATLPGDGIYAWGVSSWGPGQGSVVNERAEGDLILFGKV